MGCNSMNTPNKDCMLNDRTNKMVYNVEDIQKLLSLGRNSTYAFLDKVYKEQKPFKVLKFGKSIRVPKVSFDNWLNGKDDNI